MNAYGKEKKYYLFRKSMTPGIYHGEGRAKEHGEVSDLDSVVWQDCTASPRLPRDACIVLVYIGRHIIQIHVHSRCKDMARKEVKKALLAMTLNKGIRVHVFCISYRFLRQVTYGGYQGSSV